MARGALGGVALALCHEKPCELRIDPGVETGDRPRLKERRDRVVGSFQALQDHRERQSRIDIPRRQVNGFAGNGLRGRMLAALVQCTRQIERCLGHFRGQGTGGRKGLARGLKMAKRAPTHPKVVVKPGDIRGCLNGAFKHFGGSVVPADLVQ